MNTINLNKNIHTVLHWKTKNSVDRIVYNYTQFTFLEKQDTTFVCLNKNGCTVWPMSLWASNIAMQGHIKGCIFKQKLLSLGLKIDVWILLERIVLLKVKQIELLCPISTKRKKKQLHSTIDPIDHRYNPKIRPSYIPQLELQSSLTLPVPSYNP